WVISFRDWPLQESPLPHVAHHADNLLPRAKIAPLGKQLAQSALVRPEFARHGAIDDYWPDHLIRLLLRHSDVVCARLLETPRDLQVSLNRRRREQPPLQQRDAHGSKILRRHPVRLHELIAHPRGLPALLNVVVAPALQR